MDDLKEIVGMVSLASIVIAYFYFYGRYGQ